jgi:PAS domain S-box-containing protein
MQPPQTPPTAPTIEAFPPGQSELSHLIRAHDWAGTALGPIAGWSATQRAIVAMMVLSAVPMAAMWGAEGIMVYNDAYAAMAGPRHPMLLGSPVRDAWPEFLELTEQFMRVGMAGGTLTKRDYELELTRSDRAESAWLNLDFSPLLDETGAPAGVLAIVTETTGRVLAERDLAGQQSKMRAMFDQAPGFIAMMEGPEHVFVLINRAYTTLMGPRNVIGRTVRDAVPEAIGQGLVAALDDAYRSGKPFVGSDYKFAIPGEEGRIEDHYLDFVYQPIFDDAGTVCGIFAQGSDVTERVLAERELRESRAEYRRLNDGLLMAHDILGLVTRPPPESAR